MLRRASGAATSDADEIPLDFGDLVIDPMARTVTVRGDERALTAREFDLLLALARRPRAVLNRATLPERVWGSADYIDPSTVTVHVRRVRAKIEDDPSQPRHIKTERSVENRTRIGRRGSVVAGMFVAVMVVLTLAGCGGSTTATPTPSPSPSESSLISRLAALKAYKAQVQPIVTQLTATAISLPAAVKGMNTRPDSTWTASAANLTVIAAELGDEAASLEALIPPSALADVQAAAVTAIQNVQAALTKTADALNKGVVTSATKVAAIQSQMESLKTQISGLSEKVTSALDSVTP